MNLIKLLKDYEIKEIKGEIDLDINGIEYNSKEVENGSLFIAIKGEKLDGHNFLIDADNRGAEALLVSNFDFSYSSNKTFIRVDDTLDALAFTSSKFYGQPSDDINITGITGTNGKTTVSYLLETIWKGENQIVGVIGTVNYRYLDKEIPSSLTTPLSRDLQQLLLSMRSSGVDHTIVEVSSHSLDKKRLSYCNIDCAIFTNITQDHLDYHLDFNSYLEAKKKLFTDILNNSNKKNKFAISNLDDPYGVEILGDFAGDKLFYSINNRHAEFYTEDVHYSNTGIEAKVITPWGGLNLSSPLIGVHNLSNILASIASGLCMGANIDKIEKSLPSVTKIPGRLEKINNSCGLTVYVDYAHTPDALKNVLLILRELTQDSLVVVFGCGGDRDVSKRPLMGRHAIDIADVVIVTSDNPRSESPDKILYDIEDGIKNDAIGQKQYYKIVDRKDAIFKAISIAQRGDTVLVAGKGHEDYQIIGDKRLHFDDREICIQAIEEVRNRIH